MYTSIVLGLQGFAAHRRCESQFRPCPVVDLTDAQAAERSSSNYL